MTVRASANRRATAGALITLLLLLLALAIGCSDDKSDPTYPEQPEPPIGTWFLGVWGSGADDVYVVGQPGLIFHWNGTDWTQQTSGTEAALTSVWGDGSGTVYITGHQGVILRNTGSGWSSMDSGTENNLFSVGEYQDQIMACGRDGTLRVLSGSTWSTAPDEIYTRDAEDAVLDTLLITEDIESLTTVMHYGVTGSDGAILMEDPQTDWQLRKVTGGQEWVTCSFPSSRISGNFIATEGGRLFQLEEAEGGRLSWGERFSPALGSLIYGLHSGDADTVWAVTEDGRINRIDPPYDPENQIYGSLTELYDDGLVLFDIWGTSGTNLYAVGIDGRVLHFHEVAAGEFGWELETLPLPDEAKSHASAVFDKFGRAVH